MTAPKRSDWERLIVSVTQSLENAGIIYHLDGSTALFAHGIDFEMDDVDITVKWGQIETTREVFKQYEPSPLRSLSPDSFHFQIDDLKVHVMSYESPTGIGNLNDRVQVLINGSNVWSKTVDFYRRHMSRDHPLTDLVASYLDNRG